MISWPNYPKMPKPANKPIIAVDIDEVLAPQFQDLIDWYNKMYGTKLTLADNYPKDPRPWGTNNVEVAVKRVHKFFETDGFKKQQPFQEAKAALKVLNKTYRLVVITGRDNMVKAVTKNWLDRHFTELFAEVHLTAVYSLEGKTQSKAKLMKDLGISYLIDDNLDHVIEAAHEGLKALLFGIYPWNRAEELTENITRVKNWQDVLEYFDNEQGR